MIFFIIISPLKTNTVIYDFQDRRTSSGEQRNLLYFLIASSLKSKKKLKTTKI